MSSVDWKKCLLTLNATLDTNTSTFQCEILHNILFLNKMFFKFENVLLYVRFEKPTMKQLYNFIRVV